MKKTSLPREQDLNDEIARWTGTQDIWVLKSCVEQAIEERIEVVFARLDRLIAHGYDHNFNCTNFNGDQVNLLHAGRGPRLSLHNDGSVWVCRGITRDDVIDASDGAGFDRLLTSVQKPYLVQIAWYRIMHRYGGYTLLFFGIFYGIISAVMTLFQ